MSGKENFIEYFAGTFAILWITSVLILLGNILTVLLILCSSKLKNPTGTLMITLAFADIGVGVATLIPLIHYTVTPELSQAEVSVMGYLNSITWVISVYTLMLLSLDRYLAINKPLKYMELVTQKTVSAAVALVVLGSCLLWLLPLVGVGGFKFNDEEVACYFDVTKYPVQWIIYMVLIFIPSCSVILFCYWKIWKTSRGKVHNSNAAVVNESEQQPAVATLQKINWKAARTLLFIMCAFFIAWLPFIVEHIVKACLGKLENIPEWLEIAIYILAISNSFWNPIIYISTNSIFRSEFKRLILKIFRRNS